MQTIPRDYLSVQIDDPSLPEPISAAMFHGKGGEEDLEIGLEQAQGRVAATVCTSALGMIEPPFL